MAFNQRVLFCVLMVPVTFSYSQMKTKGITYERNDDKSITFRYVNEVPGSVYVILKFTELTNAFHGVVRKTVSGFGGELVTLHPNRVKENIGFGYSYRTVAGNFDAKPDTVFKYVLPFKNGKTIQVRNLNYLGKRFGNTEPKNWRSFQFLAQPNDTVYAIRKGLVVGVTDGNYSDETKEFSYRNKTNSVLIEHEDGTLANFDVLENNSIMVHVGDMVYPSMPLAVAGTYDLEKNSQLRLSIYYLDDIVKNLDFDEKSKENFGNKTHLYAYVDPLFCVHGNEAIKLEANEIYMAVWSDALIEAEMSKREKKKWKK